MVKQFSDYSVGTLKKVLTSYNKSVRKRTYAGVSKLKKSEVINKLNQDFNPVFSQNAINLKHKSGRFTKKLR